jgi:hypothetical protein
MPKRALMLGALWLVLVPASGALLAQGGPESLLPRHYTDTMLLSPENPISPAQATAYAVPSDVPREHWTVVTPKDALSIGLLGPTADGKFHPSRTVTREELLGALRHLACTAAGANASAVRKPVAEELLGQAASGDLTAPASRRDLARGLAGVLTNFDPAAAKLRGAMDTATEAYFDIPEGDPGFRAIMGVRQLGLVRGWEDGGFHPDQPFTRAELAESLVWTWQYLKGLS